MSECQARGFVMIKKGWWYLQIVLRPTFLVDVLSGDISIVVPYYGRCPSVHDIFAVQQLLEAGAFPLPRD